MVAAVGALALLAAAGCDHKHIVCPGDVPRSVSVLFSWENAPAAAPAGMSLYFFPADGESKFWRFDIAGKEGGPVEIPTGRYRLIAVNNDLRGVTFNSATDYDAFCASAPGAPGGRVMPTGMLYAATVEYLEVTMCGVSYRDPQGAIKDCPYGIVRCAPDSSSVIYTVILKDVKGLEHLRSAQASLSGLAPRFFPAQRRAEGSPVATAPFQLRREGTALSGLTSGFGPLAGKPSYTLDIYVTRADGTQARKTLDVTSQVLNYGDKRRVYIVIEGLEIPAGDVPPGPGDIGINVGVDGWTAVNIDITSDLP